MTTKQDKSLSRRDFLKLSGVTGAAAAFLGSLPQARQAIARAGNLAKGGGG